MRRQLTPEQRKQRNQGQAIFAIIIGVALVLAQGGLL